MAVMAGSYADPIKLFCWQDTMPAGAGAGAGAIGVAAASGAAAAGAGAAGAAGGGGGAGAGAAAAGHAAGAAAAGHAAGHAAANVNEIPVPRKMRKLNDERPYQTPEFALTVQDVYMLRTSVVPDAFDALFDKRFTF